MGPRAVGLTGLKFGTEMGFHPGKVETYVQEPFQAPSVPSQLAFAMTINKCQGQSLRVAGINLEQPCFSHGQLYVVCSRVGSPERLFILSPEGKTKNIVYQKALR
ncbi:uncharacterized protein LOC135226023 [Macrobrachium nipponense]|uniref:uncharacterized protein LOC135226023 n=1 Tax=Macrobrachium nipponense TaxID=159736 RepID=UPI0030C81AFF